MKFKICIYLSLFIISTLSGQSKNLANTKNIKNNKIESTIIWFIDTINYKNYHIKEHIIYTIDVIKTDTSKKEVNFIMTYFCDKSDFTKKEYLYTHYFMVDSNIILINSFKNSNLCLFNKYKLQEIDGEIIGKINNKLFQGMVGRYYILNVFYKEDNLDVDFRIGN